jgi:glycosyltransferase involved in cell wall biosynthesis
MDYSKYINMLRSINFTILPIKNTQRLNYTGQTSKIYQFMDCKKPVITTNYGFISEFAKKTKNIYFCSNLEEFTRAICELKRNEFRYYEDLDLTNYYIENRKEELERILKDTVPYYG